MPLNQKKKLTLDMPATYRIKVQGFLEDVWSDRLAGMAIKVSIPEEHGPITGLTGEVTDQAELIGVLNGLHELRMPILSVEMVETGKVPGSGNQD